MAKSTKQKQQENNNGEVLELEAEEIPLEKVIETALVKNNITDQVIAALKDNYGGLKLRDIEDKEMYLEIKTAKNNTRKVGISVEKLCKKGREDAIAIQRKWLAKEKEILAKIAEVEDPLQAEIDRFDANVERKETEAANSREEAYMKRQQQLLRMGAVYDNGSFVLNHISYEATLVKESDEDIWTETILPKYQKEYEKNESERVAIEKKREEEAAALKLQQEEMNKQRQELERQQLEFKKAQEDLQRQQTEAEQQRLSAQRKLDEEARVKKDAIRNHRVNELAALGMTYNFAQSTYLFQDVNVHVTEITTKTDEEWTKLIDEITPVIEDRKADLEVKRLEKIAEEKKLAEEIAVQRERARIAEENRQLEIKRKQEEENKRIQMEQASDKMKWDHFLVSVKEIKYPDMKNATYKSKIEEARKFLIKIINL